MYEYFRHWTTEDIAVQVIHDPYVGTPGFKHSLAGKGVVVEGVVTNITTYETTLGSLSYSSPIVLDDFDGIRLQAWGPVPCEAGERFEMKVRFEWSVCNDETHVYFPQIDFPNFVMPAITTVVDAVSFAAGMVLVPNETDGGRVLVNVFDQFPPIRIEDANCSLRAGVTSFAAEYMQVLGRWTYGREVDRIDNLTRGTSQNGDVFFTDSDGDGFVGSGDFFELLDLQRPEPESGIRCYMDGIHIWPASMRGLTDDACIGI